MPSRFWASSIVRDHGYIAYDTLLATDSNFKIRPQMADWKVSDGNLTYTFTLRDGLKWHDGTPVTAEDCMASLKRWGRVDNMGQKLMDFTASIVGGSGDTAFSCSNFQLLLFVSAPEIHWELNVRDAVAHKRLSLRFDPTCR